MSEKPIDDTPKSSEDQFFKALMAHIMAGAMIPKVQIERAIGPIIGFFLAEALTEKLGENIITLCPEFPIRKARLDPTEIGNNQSTNIDWLMFNLDRSELILLELKTTDTTFKPEQANIYQQLQASISEKNSAKFLIDELDEISAASQEKGKYQNVLKILEQQLPDVRHRFALCNTAKVIYLAPQASRPKEWDEDYAGWSWLSFSDLPEKIDDHAHASHWPSVRDSLLTIDDLTRRIRNGDDLISAGKNYKQLYTYDEVLKHARTDREAIVIGLMDWRKKLPSMTIAQLQAKIYKCDTVSDSVGKKIEKNWISGKAFISHIDQLAT